MFGVYRTLLALAVLFQHLADVPLIGHFAVYGFFVLSGFLMTSIMQGTYGYTWRGRTAYFINRFLRLFPAYWILCTVSIGLILIYGDAITRAYQSAIYLPSRPIEFLSNLTLIFPAVSPKWVEPRLAPPTWALTLELIFYVVIGLGASRSRKLTWLWFTLGVAYFAMTYLLGMGHESRYSYLPAASLPFSIGALLYHYKEQSRQLAARVPGHPLAWLLAYVPLAFVAQLDQRAWIEPLFLANIALHTIIIAKLRNLPRSGWIWRCDKTVGDLSYPVYLGHYQAGLLVAMTLWGTPVHGFSPRGLMTALLAAFVAVCLGYLINRLVDHNVERARRALKQRVQTAGAGA